MAQHHGGDILIAFGGSDWHTHADIESDLSGLPEGKAVRQYIDRIINDQVVIAIERVDDRITGIWPIEDPAAELEYKPAHTAIEFRRWSSRAEFEGRPPTP